VAVISATMAVFVIVFMVRSFAWEPVDPGKREPSGCRLFTTLRADEDLVRLVRKRRRI
jgi:hypothetical protein